MQIVLPDTPAFAAVRQITGRIGEAGFRALLVGGSVRDLILGKTPEDLDLVTTATPEKILSLFPGSDLVGASFGVVLIKFDGFSFECASARKERSYMDGRHPDKVLYTDDFSVDSERRDFTINALMCDPLTGEVFDWHRGIDDLKNGVIRTVGDPDRRFGEDYLRMLRAVRFAAKYGFEIDGETASAIKRRAKNAADISPERINSEVTSILTNPRADLGLELLEKLDLLKHILPEVAAMRGVTQPVEFHPEGDVFDHTKLMLRHMTPGNKLVAWSVLLHDVGKPLTRSVEASGRIRFFNHEVVGAEVAEKILTRLRFSNEETNFIVHAVADHMRFAFVPQMRKAKQLRLIAAPGFALEAELNRLDCRYSNGCMESFTALLDLLAETPTRELPKPLVSGDDLIDLGATPGPGFKKILDALLDAQLTGEVSDRDSALALAAELLAANAQ